MNVSHAEFVRTRAEIVTSYVSVIHADADGARPASAGAHRLGWYIAESDRPHARAVRLTRQCEQSEHWLERVVLGEVVPDDFTRLRLSYATDGAVRYEDWDRAANAEWLTKPEARG